MLSRLPLSKLSRLTVSHTMKYLLIIAVLVSAPIYARSAPSHEGDDCIKCAAVLVGNPAQASELDSIRQIASMSSSPDYKHLGATICILYSSSRNLTKSVKDTIYKFVKEEEGIADPSPADVLRLLNQHKNELTCDGKHIVNRAFERGKYNEIVDELFAGELYTEDVKFDFNAITYTKNPETGEVEPMTVLDYIEKVALKKPVLADSSKSEITGLKELLIEEFGAKRFSDLPIEERQAFEKERKL